MRLFRQCCPVARLYCHPCHGQVTTFPATFPCASGPPAWLQIPSMADHPSAVRNTATMRVPTTNSRPSPSGMSAGAAMRVRVGMGRVAACGVETDSSIVRRAEIFSTGDAEGSSFVALLGAEANSLRTDLESTSTTARELSNNQMSGRTLDGESG